MMMLLKSCHWNNIAVKFHAIKELTKCYYDVTIVIRALKSESETSDSDSWFHPKHADSMTPTPELRPGSGVSVRDLWLWPEFDQNRQTPSPGLRLQSPNCDYTLLYHNICLWHHELPWHIVPGNVRILRWKSMQGSILRGVLESMTPRFLHGLPDFWSKLLTLLL